MNLPSGGDQPVRGVPTTVTLLVRTSLCADGEALEV